MEDSSFDHFTVCCFCILKLELGGKGLGWELSFNTSTFIQSCIQIASCDLISTLIPVQIMRYFVFVNCTSMTNKLTYAILELVLRPFSQIERLFVLVGLVTDTCSFSNLFECCFFLLAWILLVISFLSNCTSIF